MADAELNILIKARNQAKKEFEDLDKKVKQLQGKKGFGGLKDAFKAFDKEITGGRIYDLGQKFQDVTGISFGLAAGVGAAALAVGKLIQFVKQAVDETVAYATEIDNFSRLIGLSTEETSRLVQASDDLFISQETLKSGLQAATRQGIDVSTEGLKRLAEQYNKLPEGVSRSKFVLDTFGRSGAEMGKLMEIGADGIQDAMDAVSNSMIITESSMQGIIRYKQSVDNLSDSWQGVKYTIGMEIIPELDLLLRVLTPGKDAIEQNAQAVNLLEEKIRRLAGAAAMGSDSAKARIEELNKELEIARGNLDKTSGSTESLAGDLNEVTQYFRDLTTEMIFNHLAATMDSEAQMQLAMQMGLINYETYLTISSLDELTAKYDTNANGVIELTEMTAEYKKELAAIKGYQDSLKDKTVTYTINIREVHTSTNLSADQEHNPYIGLPETNRASGGPASGMTWVGDRGPELLSLPPGSRVYSNQQSMGMAGQSAPVINVYYSTVFGLSDRTKAVNELRPIFEELLRGKH